MSPTHPPRAIIVGDVHGCLAELDLLLARIGPIAGDRLFFLGDLITKGPDSLGVVRRVRALLEAYPGSCCLAGNHELMLLRRRGTAQPSSLEPLFDRADWQFFETLPLVARLPEFGVILVHAGFPPAIFSRHGGLGEVSATWWRDEGERAMLLRACVMIREVDARGYPASPLDDWTPHWHWSLGYRGEEGACFYGHDPRLYPPEPRIAPHAIGLDTGCCFGGRLTAAILAPGDDPARPTFASVPARERYAEPPERLRVAHGRGREA
jgi:diadenosine tetraphosphatase ApaH/serine/threonine PP2A family protein phosphatase